MQLSVGGSAGGSAGHLVVRHLLIERLLKFDLAVLKLVIQQKCSGSHGFNLFPLYPSSYLVTQFVANKKKRIMPKTQQ